VRERQLELPAPPAQLSLEVAGRFSELVEAARRRIDRVQLDQSVDELVAQPGAVVLGEDLRKRRPDHDPEHPFHQIEGRADYRLVLAHEDRARTSCVRAPEGRQHPVFPADVVRGGQERPARRASQDPLAAPPAHEEGLVGVAGLMALDGDLASAGQMLVEVASERDFVDERRKS
jgi:hypothetical protein